MSVCRFAVCWWLFSIIGGLSSARFASAEEKNDFEKYRQAAMKSGDPLRGKTVFASKKANCVTCHRIGGDQQKPGPDLKVVGDKFSRRQLVRAVLQPSSQIHPDYATRLVITADGKTYTGIVRQRNNTEIQLFDAQGKLLVLPLKDVDEEKRGKVSLMPTGLTKSLDTDQFADLIAYLTTLKQDVTDAPGIPAKISQIAKPIKLVPFHTKEMKFADPVCIIAMPGTKNEFLIVEQKTRKIWRLIKGPDKDRKELFVDMTADASTGQFEGVVCLAFHPKFRENGKYYLNHHIREQGKFSPVIVERQANTDRTRDSGKPSRRLLRIPHKTSLHWGGMLAFGPDGYLYIGSGDGGPQEDPAGNSQNLQRWLGSILRIDVDNRDDGKPYGIPRDNPFRKSRGRIRPEIWASGMRMPWRFSFDSTTGDLWVGDIGQSLFEEVSIVRRGENLGWNVYEGFTEFSNRYRRFGETYTPPVIAYRRKLGVSVTGGYVYRGKRSPSYVGTYIFGDFESKRIWALTQKDRRLTKVCQIGESPEQISSFGIDAEGEIFVVGYQGTIFRVVLDKSVFE
jgi:putative heme-binding domain-containing protein